MMRRQQLLGPLATYDPFSDELISIAARRHGPTNHWSEAWLDDVARFCVWRLAGKSGQAVTFLNRSLLVQGQFDHPLTSIAELELGHLALQAGDLKAAAAHFEEATYSAVDFPDAGVLEEAFSGWFQTQVLLRSVGKFGSSADGGRHVGQSRKAARTCKRRSALSMAESLAMRGKTQGAIAVLDELKPVLTRKYMSQCGIGSRFNYLTAMTQYQKGVVPDGDKALTMALTWQKDGSKWLYQICDGRQFVQDESGRPISTAHGDDVVRTVGARSDGGEIGRCGRWSRWL